MTSWPVRADIAIAGAGIVGLGLALEAHQRGLSVVLVEQDSTPSGASVRNFGHGCVTAQSGVALAYAGIARQRWLELRDTAGIWVRETGTVVVARRDEELAVLREFVDRREGELLDATGVLARVPISGEGLLGGAYLPHDIRVDPRQAAPALAGHLASLGVDIRFATTALSAETGVLHTSRGDIHAPLVILALGHDVDRIYPDEAAAAGVTRCTLHMVRVASPEGRTFTPGILTGTSLMRYAGFVECPSSEALRQRIHDERPDLLEWGVNHMMTQHPSGDLIVGDTHTYDHTPAPFAEEDLDELLLSETRTLLGVESLEIKQRWRGVYASAPAREYLCVSPAPGVGAVAVTSGIGMTTGLGFASAVLDQLGASRTGAA